MQQSWTFDALISNRRRPNGQACPISIAYGYGLAVSHDCTGRRFVSHSGGLPGFGTHWLLLPEYGVGVVAFVNQTYTAPNYANYSALDTLLTLAGLRPRAVAPPAILAQRKTELAALLPEFNTLATNPLFAENFFLDEDVATRRKAAQALLAQAGPIRSVGELEPENQLRGRFRLLGEWAAVDVFFTLSPETPARVQQLELTLVPTP